MKALALPSPESVTEKSSGFEVVNTLGVCCATFDSPELAFQFIKDCDGSRGNLHVEHSRTIEYRHRVFPAPKRLKVVGGGR